MTTPIAWRDVVVHPSIWHFKWQLPINHFSCRGFLSLQMSENEWIHCFCQCEILICFQRSFDGSTRETAVEENPTQKWLKLYEKKQKALRNQNITLLRSTMATPQFLLSVQKRYGQERRVHQSWSLLLLRLLFAIHYMLVVSWTGRRMKSSLSVVDFEVVTSRLTTQ